MSDLRPQAARSAEQPTPVLAPVSTRRDELVETLHGVEVSDPYRWLEDLDGSETRAWIEEQNRVSDAFFSSIPEREAIRRRIESLWNYEKVGLPSHRGDWLYFSRNSGLQNQSVIYRVRADAWRSGGLERTATVVLDPNGLSDDGTVSINTSAVSEDGRLFAYGLSEAGSDWVEIHVRDVEHAIDLPDRVRWVKFSHISWRKDGSGFFYSRYPEPKGDDLLKDVNRFHQVWFHKIGTPQTDDKLIYERPDRESWGFSARVTDDDRWLVIEASEGTARETAIFLKSLEEDGPVFELLGKLDAQYEVIHNTGDVFYLFTDHDAPRGRIVSVDVAQAKATGEPVLHEIVAERRSTLRGVEAAGGRLVASYLTDARGELIVYRLDGSLERTIELPAMGSVSGVRGRSDSPELFYAFSSFTYPTTIFRIDLDTAAQETFHRPNVGFDPEDFVIEQVFYSSRDGTRVPLFISRKKGVEPDGDRPVYLYGYGGFNIPITPSFSVPNLVWMEMGGIYAQACLRGGGEYGEEWHLAGTKHQKQNVFDDFLGAAEHLVASGYTRPERLSIGGRSNGGLLVGASITQRPELFGAAIVGVGVLDMLRFHKFTIGWAWVSDYGSPDDPDDFRALYAYSPYHSVRKGQSYPATLISTADHDDRVVPLHSYKFAAALQWAQGGPNPILISIDTRAGHGAGKPTSMLIDEWAENWAFLLRSLRMELPEGFTRIQPGS